MKNIIFLFGSNETEINWLQSGVSFWRNIPFIPSSIPSNLPFPPTPNWILAIVIFIAPTLGRIRASEFLNWLEGVTDMVDTTQTPNQLRKLCRGSPVDLFILFSQLLTLTRYGI